MKRHHPVFSLLTVPQVGAYLITLPGTAAPGANADCSEWVEAVSGLTCASIEATFSVSEANFEAWNPTLTELGDGCTVIDGLYYCVQINFSSSSSAVATSTSSTTSVTSAATTLITSTTTASGATTTTGNGITTPTPTQTGMATDCDAFHLVVSGDTCAVIAVDAGISLDDFYAWNPAVGDTCLTLDLGHYVCIDIIGYTATTTTIATTTSGNGITTPTPIQTGMVTDCDVFHLVVSGDTCYDIAEDAGISLDTFYDWNPAVGDTCASLDLGYYVCIGIL